MEKHLEVRLHHRTTRALSFSRSHGTGPVWASTKGPILNFAEGKGLSMLSGYRVGQCES